MPKDSPSTSARPGPSRPSHAGNAKRVVKVIPKTVDLLKKSEKGKGKERELLGELDGLVKATKNLPGALQVEKFAETRALEILAFQNAIKSAA
ncbi:hypothetical protein P7C73_g3485, partial [Tremellales sp. Uapishka_1]